MYSKLLFFFFAGLSLVRMMNNSVLFCSLQGSASPAEKRNGIAPEHSAHSSSNGTGVKRRRENIEENNDGDKSDGELQVSIILCRVTNIEIKYS